MKYVLSVDQSTQGTKAVLLDAAGRPAGRSQLPHRQLISDSGWVSHDPEEIYQNVLRCATALVEQTRIPAEDILCMGISNQRETALAWERETGRPVCHAVVWQCSRAEAVCQRLLEAGCGPLIRQRTGLPLSPYFPAAKLAWILETVPGAREKADAHQLCFGTVDSWLIYRLTGGECYKTDCSNASRTQLFDLNTLAWDGELCRLFGLDSGDLAQVCDSDSVFGETDLGGLLKHPIPICGVLGDSHAALFGQGCFRPGMTKATYGTGSSVMMNIGERPIYSGHGLVTSLAWRLGGKVSYVMEGNINYTGAVVAWMEKELGLVSSAEETAALAAGANPEDTAYLVPAFSGLGAPYWNSGAKALLCGITRLTGRAELVRAGLECIAYQIADVVNAMTADTEIAISELRVDGGPTRNRYLMQFQSDILSRPVAAPDTEELSALGAGYLAGSSRGLYPQGSMQNTLQWTAFAPAMPEDLRRKKYGGWQDAVRMCSGPKG